MLENDQQPDENTLPADAAVVENTDIAKNNESLDIPLSSDKAKASQPESVTDINAIEGELESLFAMAQKFVTNNKVEMVIGAGGLLLLLILLSMIKRRKEGEDSSDDVQNPDNDDEDLFTNQPATVDEDKLEKSININDARQTVETVVMDKKAVAELIEQADMLVAYTDFEKAMVLLKQAKQQEPNNQLVLLKLLFVMFKLQLKDPFVTLARSLNIDKDSTEWLEITAWGRQLAPLNTLFYITAADRPASALNLDAFSAVKDDNLLLDPISDKEVDGIEANSSNTIEFNLDDYGTDDVVSTADSSITTLDEIKFNDDTSLNFDTSFTLDDENKNTDLDTPLNFEVDSNTDDIVLSLDGEPLSLDLTEQAFQPEILSTKENTLDNLQHLNIDLDSESENSSFDFDISGYDEIDEAETKLDLAAAYADMGDPDGARNILEEVLKEGNDEQKSKAQALLKNLS